MPLEKIGDISIVSLAREFGSPCYVYDKAVIEARVRDVKSFGTVRYALKACSNTAILSIMRKNGVVVDCVSEGEMLRAMKVGYQAQTEPPQFVYTCDIFDHSSLEFVNKHKVMVNAGSIDMIHQYGPNAARKDITLRVNPGFGHGHSQKTNTGGESSKHGIWHEDLYEALSAAAKYGLRVEGLHMHIGSGTDFKHLSTVCDAMLNFARKIGPGLRMVSAGGGLPVPYKDGEERIDVHHYSELWWKVRDTLAREFGHPMQLELEPGRYLICEAGFLISEIRAIKHMGKNTFYLLDAGFNNLARPIMYGAYHGMSIVPADGRKLTGENSVVVAGPLCESGDVFTQLEGGFVVPRELPVARVGDYLVIHNAGAYGTSMGSNYNSKPHCAEVLVSGNKAKLIRKRQPLEELFGNEIIPEDLI